MAPTIYADVLARNIRAARSRADLSQQTVAARMRALGYEAWLYQTVGNVEKGRRRVTAEEVFGLAFALETSVGALMSPVEDDKVVDFPSGAAIPVASARESVQGKNDGAVQWEGESPVFPAALSTPVQMAAAGIGQYTRVSAKQGVSHLDPATGEWRPPVVAAIVTSLQGVLVGKRRDGSPPWTFIAGEQDAVQDESPQDTAVREVKEEAGLRIRVGEVIGTRVHPQTGRTMVYIAATPTHGTDVFVNDEDELTDVRWVSLAEAGELLPGMFEPVREYLVRELGGAE